MKRISYTNKFTAPSGLPYSNFSPCYTETREYDIDFSQEVMDEEFNEIKQGIDARIFKDIDLFTDSLKERGCEGHRFSEVDGIKTPHVTNILTPDRPPIPNIEEYAAQGTMLDEVVKMRLDMGLWVYPEERPTPNVKAPFSELFFGIADWFKKNPEVRLFNHSRKVYNKEFCYCGEYDAVGYAYNMFTIADVKRTKKITKELYSKYMMQMAAYAKCLEVEPDLMCIISPYNPPIVEGNIDKYFHKFLLARGAYKQRFGV